jgi:hypothetical protein
MIEPPSLFTHDRLIFDIREIESLATLIMDLSIPIDRTLCESFERLVELAGTRDFVLAFSKLQEYMYQIKVRQSRSAELGMIVPASSLQELNDYGVTKNGGSGSSYSKEENRQNGGGLAGVMDYIKVEPMDLAKLGLRKPKSHDHSASLVASGTPTSSKTVELSLIYQSPFHQAEGTMATDLFKDPRSLTSTKAPSQSLKGRKNRQK